MTARSLPRPLSRPLAAAALALAAGLAAPATAQTAPDTMIVFDGSGSMWGRIEGRTKIEIARDTLSSVLSESAVGQRMGMIAYGHRRKGQCSDIETVVPIGPARSTVPAMLEAARGLSPKGKTPLTDAVRRAADELRFTENAATVVLVTDGIETCDADPCALGRELEAAGIDFTAHVVGFGLSAEEGRQVQCLADNTGGLYIQASDAGELGDALRRTIESAPEPEPVAPAERTVHFMLRDSDDAGLLGARQLEVLVERADGSAVDPEAFGLNYPEVSDRSATGRLEPGDYRLLVTRDTKTSGGYRTALDFTVPPGEGVHTIEASLAGTLVINTFLNPGTPFDPANPPESGRRRAWGYFHVFPVVNGKVADEPVAEAHQNLRFPLPAGRYLIRATLDRALAAEKLVEVGAGAPTEVDFSFDATRVFVDAREADGFPVKRQTTYFYDRMRQGRNYFASGRGAGEGGVRPFFLPVGTFLLNVGGEGYGARRSELLVEVPGDFADIRLEVGEGETPPPDAAARITPCVEMVAVKYTGCLMRRASLAAGTGDGTKGGASPGSAPREEASAGPMPGDDPAAGAMPGDDPMPSDRWSGPFQGVWSTPYGEVALLQRHRHVYGDYRGREGMIVGRMQEDGRTMRGIFIYPDGNRWGGVEWRMSGDGASVEGGWADGAPVSADRGNWNAELDTRAAPTLVHWPTLGEDWWSGVEAARRRTIEDWAGGALLASPAALPATADAPSRSDVDLGEGSGAGTSDEAAAPGDSAGMPEALAGLAGTAHAFRGPDGAIGLHIVLDANGEAATMVLSRGWCGVAACRGGRASVHRDHVALLEADRRGSSAFGAGSYRIELSSTGDETTAEVSGEGASRVRFELFDRIELGGGRRADASAAGDAGSLFGVFSLHADASIEEVVGDPTHMNACRRRPVVIYPDATIAFKGFTEPRTREDNPYRDAISGGACDVSGADYACTVSAASGASEPFDFNARSLGEGHWELCEAGDRCTIAASCFHPGGPLRAADIMPNGRPLGELMIERADGASAGFGFDGENRPVLR